MPKHARIVLGYVVLGLLLTWPMIARFTTHVPGDGIDDPSLAWNLWWVKHALVDTPQNPFACSWQFWPVGINLAFYTLTVLNGMLGVPLQSVFGLIPTYNLLLLSSFVLSGLGGYLLAREFLSPVAGRTRADMSALVAAAFVAGALYAFASSKLFYAALGQGNIASSQWIPFAALYIWRAARVGGRPRDAALAGLFLVLQAYAELTYASFLLVFAVLAFLWALRRYSHAILGRFVLIGVLFVLGIAPILANMLPDLAAEGDFFTSGGGFADLFSADLAGYLAPTQLHPLLGGIVRDWSQEVAAGSGLRQFPVDKGQHIYLGYTALALTVLGVNQSRGRRATLLWTAAAGLFFLLTLGPSLRLAGFDTGIPLPFRIMEVLPFFKGNRYPSRYSVMLLVSLTPLVASGTLVVLRWRRISVLPAAVLILVLVLFEHLSSPLPTFDLRVPAVYERVAQEPDDFALLELPLGWRNGARVAGKQDVIIMQQLWYQTTHGKRLLGGNTSRNPEFKFQYFGEQPTLARLIALTNAADVPQHDALREALPAPGAQITGADRAQAAKWAAFSDIRYVMIHRDKLPKATEIAVQDLLPLRLVAEEGALALYRIEPLSEPPLTFVLNSDAGRIALGEGWGPPSPGSTGADAAGVEWPAYAQRPRTRLILPLGPDASTLQLRAGALVPEQSLTLAVGGRVIGEQALSMQPGWLSFNVPPDPDRGALSDVTLLFSRTTSVDELAMRLSRAGPAALLVRSAGQETGDFGHIFMNGHQVSPNRRGYNLVALDAAGALLDAANFDTHADPAASAHLAKWLAAWPPGTVLAGAVRDEASLNLGPEAIDAFRALGVDGDLRGHFRWGHAFIVAVREPDSNFNAPHNTWAMEGEGMDAIRPVQLSFGLPLSEPRVAAQVFEVQIVK